MTTTEELYGMSKQDLDFRLYKEIVRTLQKAQDAKYSGSHVAMLINDAQVSTRLNILKDRRFKLMESGYLKMSKEEEVIVDKIVEAIAFWQRIGEN